jgi:C-terminal processing protease CtpA/Prc
VDSLVTGGAHGLVIDLRGNPGGLLTQGVEMAVFPETFIPYYPYFSFVEPPVSATEATPVSP